MTTGVHDWEGRLLEPRDVSSDATLAHENDVFTSPLEQWLR